MARLIKSQWTGFAALSLCIIASCQKQKTAPSVVTSVLEAVAADDWKVIAPGLEFGEFAISKEEKRKIMIVRIDLTKNEMGLYCCAEKGHGKLTADAWAERYNLNAVINAGMFDTDHKTHLGYLKNHDIIGQSKIRSDYSSVVAFAPVNEQDAAFKIFDTDVTDVEKEVIPAYHGVVQNLRLIKKPGENRWQQQEKAWSEAAIGEDKQGRALLIFCPVGMTMHDFNELMLKLPIGLEAAQHLEGGPEASLYLKCGDLEVKGIGSYETGFREDDSNNSFWPLPNVLGMRIKK
jgi:Phosphodiester glycosidase